MFYNSNLVGVPSLTGDWTDSSAVAIGYSPIEDTFKDAFTKTQAVIAQQIFQKAIEGDERFKDLKEDQISTLMRNFAFAYWQGQPKFSKKHVLCNLKTLDCRIYENMQDALDDMIEGFVYCFDVTY